MSPSSNPVYMRKHDVNPDQEKTEHYLWKS